MQPATILATDCGSTTTKAILIQRQGDEYRLAARGEAPTTVETPFDDVTLGVLNAVREVEDLTGLRLATEDGLVLREDSGDGADLYVSTSSAGGGLQMTVAGVVSAMTAESASRAALGAGAIVMDVIAVDDGRREHERIERIRHMRPDMILLSGGTDGGTITHVVETAELLLAADPKPRLGSGYRLPVVYAGNRDARAEVEKILSQSMDLRVVDNIRPTLELENLGPAREAIHELFLEHVMQQAPGYSKLTGWTSADIMPTPQAVGMMVQTVAQQRGIDVLAVDIGGATTDVFTMFGGQFHRTVSANLGMSYSICNVLAEAGTDNVLRWLPFPLDRDELRNRLRNKMIRPTTIPQTIQDLLVEQALAREALRLALEHHRSLAVGLKGIQQERTIGDALSQAGTGQTVVSMRNLGLLIGSGGVLSHAPQRAQSALMLLDAFQPEGVTELAVDSIFMMPQLGVLAQVVPEASVQVFERDCLIPLGTCLAPVGQGKPGDTVAEVRVARSGAPEQTVTLQFGELVRRDLPQGATARLTVTPERRFDCGAGFGKELDTEVVGGVVGLLLDARGRPLVRATDPSERQRQAAKWLGALGLPTGEGD
ncbi:MAG: methylaspartate mutase [Armatimonadetes bacterium CG_4_10_14_3_um_filter_66_18]|nr:methylaspartate mutase [Armatimonadota bacterium]OIP09958.1 MAG: methylaspartate mutase [Armatimonadetes bacterium CG2_30_66_41]PIU95355.1 MAG: methylaspartate mutase [Armatimonadetes bacterium CG06_land_8_20_14_3_00_66_21]PIV76590.1 MAG: methylaspartate mutase [Rhodobacteraceae bacterium CG17_big_fil_post_rev_8_21_14_2_50_65_11]PIX43305.1 MAG: methylaspartate mutase [Armatimonadetes bacterium CG_4_8_14_3_um_filter_66_20]PIY46174.1 MAG: methylaspartate mutase [Armatimonadetes bacterium CG_4